MSENRMEVFLPAENKAEAESVAETLKTMDATAQRELLNYMKAFNDGVNYARRIADPKSA